MAGWRRQQTGPGRGSATATPPPDQAVGRQEPSDLGPAALRPICSGHPQRARGAAAHRAPGQAIHPAQPPAGLPSRAQCRRHIRTHIEARAAPVDHWPAQASAIGSVRRPPSPCADFPWQPGLNRDHPVRATRKPAVAQGGPDPLGAFPPRYRQPHHLKSTGRPGDVHFHGHLGAAFHHAQGGR